MSDVTRHPTWLAQHESLSSIPSRRPGRRRGTRRPCADGPETFALGNLAVQYEERRVTVGGRPVRLTATEFELLRLLTLNAGRVSTYESLIRQIWNGPDPGDPGRVRTFVKQLRRKLGDDPARPRYILNERGVGYRMPKPEE